MSHLVLLGDSIFDNGAYVAGGPDVIQQLRRLLPSNWQASLAAVDGAIAEDVAQQLQNIPPDATHLFISVGGNDALSAISVLDAKAGTVSDALSKLADVQDQFDRDYRAMLDAVLSCRLPVALCTIYDPRFPDAEMQRGAMTALCVFNDRITRIAFENNLPLIDLRLICDEDADFANPIEPSVQGGAKIAKTILVVASRDSTPKDRSEVFAS